ncbi:AAA family ATPase [Haloarcula amylovorans]|uniref:AAA family ATPase n=1 Tax=Haloarcula amylovorans TaxID=2562280 RepID=UPI0010766624|nr:MoxR family ATPase [Halomicroarcula amylolytica]
MDVTQASDLSNQVLDEVGSAVIADRDFFETVLLGVVGKGHVLLEDVPGTGKTLTAQSVATALGLSFSRVQFTPDLLPADITGTHVFNEQTREFEFTKGPIFANVVLADEINRAPPKTQSALLEAMEEGQVTVDGDTYELPQPFFVLATQNPVDMEGTFELPEAQVDRFLAKSTIGYPDSDGEVELLRRRAGRTEQSPSVEAVLDDEKVKNLRAVPETVTVDDDLLSYMADVARATREDYRVEVGVSPRGTQRLFEAARAMATIEGREFVAPDDIKRVAQPVLAHRLVLTPDARVEQVDKRDVLADVLGQIPVPTV